MEAKISKTAKRYVEAVGRRKTSTARVRMTEAAKSSFLVNDKEATVYFPTGELTRIIQDPFSKTKHATKYEITAKVSGGGSHSQAEAIRHGIARILSRDDEEMKDKVKKLGFLKRDPRSKERRKFGLKKARKAPQWSKR